MATDPDRQHLGTNDRRQRTEIGTTWATPRTRLPARAEKLFPPCPACGPQQPAKGASTLANLGVYGWDGGQGFVGGEGRGWRGHRHRQRPKGGPLYCIAIATDSTRSYRARQRRRQPLNSHRLALSAEQGHLPSLLQAVSSPMAVFKPGRDTLQQQHGVRAGI